MMERLPGRLGLTIVCFHISTGLYVVLGIGLVFLMQNLPTETSDDRLVYTVLGIVFCGLCWLCAIGVEVVVWGLKKLKYWAWVSGIVTCGFYISSIFVVLGALGMWGLLDAETQAAFQSARARRNQ